MSWGKLCATTSQHTLASGWVAAMLFTAVDMKFVIVVKSSAAQLS